MSSQTIAVEENAQKAVLVKLVAFSISLAVVPITLYFVSLKYIWNGNGIYAALTAVFAANLVLAGYIVSSLSEDKRQTKATTGHGEPESKKKR